MRVLSISLNAFGPYREKQKIDFSMLGGESIFLITGPTGAGKTTIFDAMCFALYGKASGSDRDQESMRSHFAEVDQVTAVEFCFELRGKEYRVVRMPKQMRKKERGDGLKEDPARAELYLCTNENEQIISTRIKDVNDYIEDIIGLDYEQFRKMIMIPQGEFRKLISENSKEREEILQRIFKTHFYDDLTEYFKKQAKLLEGDIERFQWKMNQETAKINWGTNIDWQEDEHDIQSTYSLLEDRLEEQRETIADEKEALERSRTDSEKAQEKYYKSKQLAESIESFEMVRAELKEHENQKEAIIHNEKLINAALHAHELFPLEKLWNQKKEEFMNSKQRHSEKETALEKMKEEFTAIKEEYEHEKEKEKDRLDLYNTWNRKVQELKVFKNYLNLKKKWEKAEKEERQKEKQLSDCEQNLSSLQHEKVSLKEKTAKERILSQRYYEWKEDLKSWERQSSIAKKLGTEWEKLKKLRKVYQQFVSSFKETEATKDQIKAEYEQALADIQNHHAYTMALHLDEGTSCPVCGSAHHPEPATKPKEVKSQKEISRLKASWEQAETKYKEAQNQLIDVKAEGDSQRQITESMGAELKDWSVELSDSSIYKVQEHITEKATAVTQKVKEIEQQLNDVEKAVRDLNEIEKREKKELDWFEEVRKEYYRSQQDVKVLLTQINTIESENEFESLSTQNLEKEIETAESEYRKYVNKWEDAQNKYQSKNENIQQLYASKDELEKHLLEVEKALEQAKKEFNQTFVQFNFRSMEGYHQALLPKDKIEEMQKEQQTYHQKSYLLKEKLETLRSQIGEKVKPDLEGLLSDWQTSKEHLNNQQESFNKLHFNEQENQKIFKQLSNLMEEQGDLAKQYYDIAELAKLAKGDNTLRLSLERYVLASFLDEILVQANIRFDQMSDHRYQLLRSDEIAKRGAQSGLDLEVLDHHTGQQRSVKTLSGGEGFKASLSLALGMADVVQSHAGGVQLDTLFIDEGFGTLDEISLEQAISCLRSLQDGNRMLGIISHVPQLKEEIPAKLQINATPNGSTVSFVFQ